VNMMYKNVRNGSFVHSVLLQNAVFILVSFDQSKHLEQIGHAKYPSWFGCV